MDGGYEGWAFVWGKGRATSEYSFLAVCRNTRTKNILRMWTTIPLIECNKRSTKPILYFVVAFEPAERMGAKKM